MFITFTLEFGRGRKKRREPVEYVDDDMPHTVVESTGMVESAPIGFGNEDRWREWEDRRDSRAKH